ncbi:MAG: hypothetical protein V2J14_06085, partial [Erythrobacter sp.]|nr:hypothetical protein [Erythrobacter sp.]
AVWIAAGRAEKVMGLLVYCGNDRRGDGRRQGDDALSEREGKRGEGRGNHTGARASQGAYTPFCAIRRQKNEMPFARGAATVIRVCRIVRFHLPTVAAGSPHEG